VCQLSSNILNIINRSSKYNFICSGVAEIVKYLNFSVSKEVSKRFIKCHSQVRIKAHVD